MLKPLFFALLLPAAAVACAGDAGVMGPSGATGPTGPTGAPGRDAVVDYHTVIRTVVDTVRVQLPALIAAEVKSQVVNQPPVNVDSIISVVLASLPATPTVDVEAIVARVKSELPVSPSIDYAEVTRRVQAELAKTPNVVNGDLLVSGRLCVFANGVPVDGSLCAQGTEMTVFGQGATISFVSNWFGTDAQYPGQRHQGSVGLSPDGGTRLGNNTNFGSLPFYNSDRPLGFAGFDSQSEWSWYQQGVGQSPLGTQSLVLRSDWGRKEFYFASWREGWKVGVRTSSDGCKWCEDLKFTFPTTP